nr:MAG TPA: hypothetical protein [Caudoviricetes sp.]
MKLGSMLFSFLWYNFLISQWSAEIMIRRWEKCI